MYQKQTYSTKHFIRNSLKFICIFVAIVSQCETNFVINTFAVPDLEFNLRNVTSGSIQLTVHPTQVASAVLIVFLAIFIQYSDFGLLLTLFVISLKIVMNNYVVCSGILVAREMENFYVFASLISLRDILSLFIVKTIISLYWFERKMKTIRSQAITEKKEKEKHVEQIDY